MSRADLTSQSCSVAQAVALVGDPWTLMIMREMFLGSRRFDDVLRLTGMSSHLLSQRLKKLVETGVLRREAYSQRPLRHEYRLTQMGLDLWPVIVAFKQWGDKWLVLGDPAVQITHKSCTSSAALQVSCPKCHSPMQAHDAEARLSPSFEQERQALRKSI